jgi:aromatic ring-cleaving dioxygenase
MTGRMDGKDDHHHHNRTKPRILYKKTNKETNSIFIHPLKNDDKRKLFLKHDLWLEQLLQTLVLPSICVPSISI